MRVDALVSFSFSRIKNNQEAGFSWSRKEQDIALADALHQAVAENLKMKFEVTNHCITAERIRDGVRAYRTNFDDSDPRHNHKDADWLAEADKLLRGEYD